MYFWLIKEDWLSKCKFLVLRDQRSNSTGMHAIFRFVTTLFHMYLEHLTLKLQKLYLHVSFPWNVVLEIFNGTHEERNVVGQNLGRKWTKTQGQYSCSLYIYEILPIDKVMFSPKTYYLLHWTFLKSQNA